MIEAAAGLLVGLQLPFFGSFDEISAFCERLGFELTAFLVGSHSLGEVITSVIQLICKNLGWQWGAYWAPGATADGDTTQRLSCQFHWYPPEHDMAAFSAESLALQMAPSEGLVGTVWQTGEASWVEDMANDPQFLRRAGQAGQFGRRFR